MRKRNRSYERAAVADRAPSSAKLRLKTPVELTVLASSDEELVREIRSDAEARIGNSWKDESVFSLAARAELYRRYRIRHGIPPKQFASEHWQTLFRLEYPGVL